VARTGLCVVTNRTALLSLLLLVVVVVVIAAVLRNLDLSSPDALCSRIHHSIGSVLHEQILFKIWDAQRGGYPTVVNLSFLDRSRYFSFKYLLIYPHYAERAPFQTHYYSENVVAPRIEPETSGSSGKTTGT
jgi:hypothetical protein